MLACRLEKVK